MSSARGAPADEPDDAHLRRERERLRRRRAMQRGLRERVRQPLGRRMKQRFVEQMNHDRTLAFVVARGVGRRVGERAREHERRGDAARHRARERRVADVARGVRDGRGLRDHAGRPAERRAAIGDEPRDVRFDRQIGGEHRRAAAERLDFGGERGGRAGFVARRGRERDVPAAPREADGERAADGRGVRRGPRGRRRARRLRLLLAGARGMCRRTGWRRCAGLRIARPAGADGLPRARPRRLGGARWRGARLHGARNQHDPRGAGRGCVAGVGWDGHLQCRDESESSRTR